MTTAYRCPLCGHRAEIDREAGDVWRRPPCPICTPFGTPSNSARVVYMERICLTPDPPAAA